MIKTFGTNKVQTMANELTKAWEEEKKEIKLSAKSLYHLIGLKKVLVDEANKITEMVRLIAEQAGATPNENGGLSIPEDKLDEVNQKLFDFAQETVDIEYDVITITEDDHVSAVMMDALFDFIEIQ